MRAEGLWIMVEHGDGQFSFRFKQSRRECKEVRANETKYCQYGVKYNLYDPKGFLSPVTIQLKILLQELHERKFAWDEPLDETSKSAWFKLVGQLERAKQMLFPRCYLVDVEEEVTSCS